MTHKGMTNHDVLQRIDEGYRHPRPHGCPVQVYEVMLQTWEANSDARPTFEHLSNYFEDYFVATEPGYKEPSRH